MDAPRPNGSPAIELLRESSAPTEPTEPEPLLESREPSMAMLLEQLRRAAAGDSTILITGESGTGKDVLARQTHKWSPRRQGPLVVISCTTFAEHLLEDELFGHVRGSFTGAVTDKAGRFEAADGGTVLLDEMAELPVALQKRFLHFLQERSFERIGSDRTVKLDVRVIATSSRNLEVEVTAGRFRQDLFYRLNVINFALPPLRERVRDILPLADQMLRNISLATGRPGLTLTNDAAASLIAYRWPGNIRELRNAMMRAAALAQSDRVDLLDLPELVGRPEELSHAPGSHGASLKEFERDHIIRVLAKSRTLSQAAATLGINVTTLWRKRRYYGIG